MLTPTIRKKAETCLKRLNGVITVAAVQQGSDFAINDILYNRDCAAGPLSAREGDG
ncbi:hypothetical protein CC1G_15786 [Coprinopsis cinerea okayama7|uniref:Uncharacterized protein n=1 Tax=Coprinopsis cinerea (strain Okayama-7 / 130 / ATCC MYA-4618 / FGSC 9003) TaxID=240176 RepID=D6RQY9_COPC7|nr:hypothetical protein CC1G_15786 [Coprinopsis cinerea okayama7\|eukprot:XP_002910066.1 hypothetical protein CC1G_15786 [Coprinopsis cinerea okayama7\